MQLHAPATVNLSFRILRRRDDGFHEIETLMAPVSLCDTLTLEEIAVERGIVFTCDEPTLSTGDDNLVVRAARIFLEETQCATGLQLHLEKRIPHGAGLGGGSSDAASVLLGLDELLQTHLPQEALARMAGRIGSDVPFFIYRSAAQCRGRGEIVQPQRLTSDLPLLLLKPRFGVPTPWAYGRWQDSRPLPGISYAPQECAGLTLVNDLERPVFEKYVFLAQMKMWLLAQPEVGAAMMSGSGATLFALLRETADGEALARRAREALDPELWSCVCRTLT